VSPKDVLIDSLLALSVLVQLACVWGLVAMPHVFDRIHFLGPATSAAPVLVAGAVVARESLSHRGIMAVLVAGFLLVFSPVLTHATIRAARVRRHGDWKLQPQEKAHRP
jgi:multisubunit Na+/H+ antiporter MnhG subunit